MKRWFYYEDYFILIIFLLVFIRMNVCVNTSCMWQQSSCDASEGPMFSRPGAPPKGLGSSSETPMFSRPSSVDSNYPNFPHVRPAAQQYKPSADDVPKFAKIDSRIGEQRCSNGE